MKIINVQIGIVRISVSGKTFSMIAGDYASLSCDMTEDIKKALVAFTALLSQAEEIEE